jgi:apolipoprotein N-acyltransferase
VSKPDHSLIWFGVGAGVSAILLALAFPPAGLSGLAWIALAPLLVVLKARPRHREWLVLWAAGLIFGCAGFWYMHHVTVLGVALLGLYLSLYFLVFCLSVRWLSFEKGIPLSLAAPLVWAGLEYLRGIFLTGLPLHFLAHSQYKALTVIQIADLTGTAGVTFWLVAVNGVLADAACCFARIKTQVTRGAVVVGGVVVLAISVGALFYGAHRLRTLRIKQGPRIALIQGNIPQDNKNRATDETFEQMLKVYVALTEKALDADPVPDLVIWPETMAPPGVFDHHLQALRARTLRVNAAVSDTAAWKKLSKLWSYYDRWYRAFAPLQKRADLLIGANTCPRPDNLDIAHNSAFLLPKGGQGAAGRFDKIHLVPFGEYVPLKSLIGWIVAPIIPYKTGLTPGTEMTVFEVDGWTYAPTICFEDTFPELVAEFGRRRRIDFIVNVTNEGWFKDGAELDEHLAIGVFRAIECRAGFVRAANTGISAFIAPTGQIVSKLVVDGRDREVAGVLHGNVSTAEGRSPYYALGETFGQSCAGVWIFCMILQIIAGITHWRRRRAQ